MLNFCYTNVKSLYQKNKLFLQYFSNFSKIDQMRYKIGIFFDHSNIKISNYEGQTHSVYHYFILCLQ